MPTLRDLVDDEGLERVTERASERLGRQVRPDEVKRYASGTRPVPKRWVNALGLDDPSPAATAPLPGGGGDPPAAGEGDTRRTETPPRMPAGSKVEPAPPTPIEVSQAARERIKALHVFIGSGVATAADADGFQNDRGVGGGIGKLWTDKADPIADAWIAWANEGNRFAQSFVKLMATGGAGGELVLGYAVLLGGTAYIIGTMPDNEATRVIYGSYAKYRPPAEAPDTSGQQPPRRPRRPAGAAADGAAGPLGDAAGTVGA